jgi:hypothetical protein
MSDKNIDFSDKEKMSELIESLLVTRESDFPPNSKIYELSFINLLIDIIISLVLSFLITYVFSLLKVSSIRHDVVFGFILIYLVLNRGFISIDFGNGCKFLCSIANCLKALVIAKQTREK